MTEYAHLIDGVSKGTLRAWLHGVCNNMLERDDYEGIGRFLHAQLDDDLNVLVREIRGRVND